MLEPIILSEEIVKLARKWSNECNGSRHFTMAGVRRHLVGEASITSPEDRAERKVALYITRELTGGVRAWTCQPGTRDESGSLYAPEGHYCILVEDFFSGQQPLFAALLHELTHVVDPVFLQDCEAKKSWVRTGDKVNDALREYALPSELRAFTAMWIEELKTHLASGNIDLDAFIEEICWESEHFRGFCKFGPEVVPNLMEQIRDHFAKMVAHFSRSAAPSSAAQSDAAPAVN
jgi:hypothetical protein